MVGFSAILSLFVMAITEETNWNVYQSIEICFYFIITGVLQVLFCSQQENIVKVQHNVFQKQGKIDENWKRMIQGMPLGVAIISYSNEVLVLNETAKQFLNMANKQNQMLQKEISFKEISQQLGTLKSFIREEDKIQKMKREKQGIHIKQKQQEIFGDKGNFSMEQVIKIMSKEDTFDMNDQNYKLTQYFYSIYSENHQRGEIQNDANSFNSFSEEDLEAKRDLELQISNHFKFQEQKTCMIIIEDVTQRNILKNLKEDNTTKKKILISFSNLLRTPLNGAIPPLENCIKDPNLAAGAKHLLNYTLMSLNLLQYVVNDIVDYALLLNNQIFLNNESFDLRSFLKETLAMFWTQAEQRELKLKKKISKTLSLNIFSEQNRLRQILINFLSNAIKFTPKGSITLFAKGIPSKPSQLCIGVKDTGVGMPLQKLKEVRERVQKCDLDAVKHVGGKGIGNSGGLGLLISQNLALCLGPKHGAGIKIKSKDQEGTVFWILVEDKSKAQQQVERETDSSSSDQSMFSINDEIDEISMEDQSEKEFQSKSQMDSQLSNEEGQLIKNGEMRQEKKEPTVYDILSVDDDAFNHLSLELMLQNFNLKMKKAFSGIDAINVIKETYSANPKATIFKAIFMDYNMPIMDGIECTKRLKSMMKEEMIPYIPIIAITANPAREEVEECFEAGMEECIGKPITYEQIKQILQAFEIV